MSHTNEQKTISWGEQADLQRQYTDWLARRGSLKQRGTPEERLPPLPEHLADIHAETQKPYVPDEA